MEAASGFLRWSREVELRHRGVLRWVPTPKACGCVTVGIDVVIPVDMVSRSQKALRDEVMKLHNLHLMWNRAEQDNEIDYRFEENSAPGGKRDNKR